MLSILTTYIAPALGTGAAITILAWILGKFTGAGWYQAFRAKIGTGAYNLGVMLSGIGKTRLGPLSEPIEDIAADWCQFIPEQFFAGLRSDNVKKMEKQLDRLEDVGSVVRAKAIAEKIQEIKASPIQTATDAAMFNGIIESGKESINENLKKDL